MEPRSYVNIPVGLNFMILGGAYQDCEMLPDPSLLAEDAQSYTKHLVFGYLRSFDLFGRSAKFVAGGSYADYSA